MILDAAALENLDVFENSVNEDSKGTLYYQLNRCVTAFGKRLLKSWFAGPLYDVASIRERQEAVAGANTRTEANGRNASKVVLYEDASKKQLQEFILVLSGCELIIKACSSLGVILEYTDSSLLHRLLTPGKDLPDVNAVLRHFKNAFDWTEAKKSGRNPSGWRQLVSIAAELDVLGILCFEMILSVMAPLSQNNVCIGGSDYASFILLTGPNMGGKSTLLRQVYSPVVLAQVGADVPAESFKMSPVDQLDVLVSIAIASDLYEGPTCRPLIVDTSSENEAPFISAKNLGHPVLRNDTLGDGTFVPNNVCIGGSDYASFILLTGGECGVLLVIGAVWSLYLEGDQVSILAKDKRFGQEMHQSEQPKALYGVPSPKDYAVTYSNERNELSHILRRKVSPRLRRNIQIY
nr:DNA mismatch repair protein MSH6 [Tanacetum cinerariifolium]